MEGKQDADIGDLVLYLLRRGEGFQLSLILETPILAKSFPGTWSHGSAEVWTGWSRFACELTGFTKKAERRSSGLFDWRL